MKKKKTTQTLSKLFSGKIIQRITQTIQSYFGQNVEKGLQGLILTLLRGRVMKVIINMLMFNILLWPSGSRNSISLTS